MYGKITSHNQPPHDPKHQNSACSQIRPYNQNLS